MALLLDADIVIDLLRGHPPAHTWLNSLTDPPSVSGFAAMETLAGSRDAAEWRRAQALLSWFPVLWPSDTAMNMAKNVFLPLRLSQGIGVLDCLTAATAIGHNLSLATFNSKHFSSLPGLAIVQPYTR